MDKETELAFKFQANLNKSNKEEFIRVWNRLDRLPRWAVILMSSGAGVIGFLASSLMHIITSN